MIFFYVDEPERGPVPLDAVEICPRCEGEGEVVVRNSPPPFKSYERALDGGRHATCPVCDGHRLVDDYDCPVEPLVECLICDGPLAGSDDALCALCTRTCKAHASVERGYAEYVVEAAAWDRRVS